MTILRLSHEADDEPLLARYQWYRFRFLLDSGEIFDVIATRDDNELRGAVLKASGAKMIAGVTPPLTVYGEPNEPPRGDLP